MAVMMTNQFTFNQAIDELADLAATPVPVSKKHAPVESFDDMEAFGNGLYEATESHKEAEHAIPRSIPAAF